MNLFFNLNLPSLIILFLSVQIVASQEDLLQMKYLGTAGWVMSEGDLTILVDPYISRLKLGQGPSISPDDTRRSFSRTDYHQADSTLIDELITEADFILVHHSHFDHLSDVPYIARKTGAKVIGSETTCSILKAYGIPGDNLVTIKGGEDYQFDQFSVRVIPSLHSALNDKQYFESRELPEVLTAPLKISQFIEGGSYMFLIRFQNKSVLTMGSMNYIEKEIEGLRPDILLAGVNYSRLEIYNYTKRLMTATGFPKLVIPVHWDNFRIPYGFSQESGIELKVKPFIQEVKDASPESEVLIPVHLETISIKN